MIWASEEQKWMTRITLSPNGEQFVIAYGDGTVGLWDTPSLNAGFPDQEPRIPTRDVAAMSFSPDGRQIAYSGDATIHILDAQSGIEMMPLEGHESQVQLVVFSPCGNLIALGSNDTTVHAWNLLSGAGSLVL